MYTNMEQWAEIRRRVLVEGVSKRQIIRETGMHWQTLDKILSNSSPPGYRQLKKRKSLLDAYAAWKSAKTGLNYRLPTEQEWEKAAGYTPGRTALWTYAYQSGSISSIYCNYNNYYGGPLPVGSFNGTGGKNDAKSYYGCYDMSGNVWEWTSSSYNSTALVIRGGYWGNLATSVAVSCRGSSGAPSVRSDFGFRLVLDL
ncbi:MAG: SUMF1/EgtB/PvdO family nonheme iron enzyme [Phycisphaerae bacterium]|nr:SUMF1/EgtB/PvdO family nonheme iron enzyme [Phycisphaerae bacterium]